MSTVDGAVDGATAATDQRVGLAVRHRPRERGGHPRRCLPALLAFVGVLAVQVAWIVALPTFRGMDEHDHAYRADAVAAGDWVSDGERVEDSRGELLPVRTSVIDAAGPICQWLPYTERYDCTAHRSAGPDRGLVASAAARYHPAFYWVIGTAARPFDGDGALYAMRVMAAVLSAVLVAAAVLVLRRHHRGSPWRPAALLVVLTPTMTYTMSVAAPNGVEVAGALLAWCACLGVARCAREAVAVPWPLGVAAAAGLVVVSTVRSPGPLWAVLIVLLSLATTAPAALAAAARRQRRMLTSVGAAWGLAMLLGALWTVGSGTNDPRSEGEDWSGSPWPGLPREVLRWVLQSTGAFPTRVEPAPPVVHALVLVVAGMLLVLGWRSAATRTRRVLVATVATVLLVSTALTVLAYPAVGYAWQGRYIWPVSMGVPLVAGLAVAGRRPAPRAAWLWAATLAVATATFLSQRAVIRIELEHNPLPDTWTVLPVPLVGVLTLLGFSLLSAGLLLPERREGPVSTP